MISPYLLQLEETYSFQGSRWESSERMHVGLSVVGVILKSGPVVGVILRQVCVADASFGDQRDSLRSCLITL